MFKDDYYYYYYYYYIIHKVRINESKTKKFTQLLTL